MFTEDTIQRNKIKQLKINSPIDIYGDAFSTEISPEKLFIKIYNELCFSYEVRLNFKMKEFVETLNKTFNLSNKDYLLKYEFSKNKKPNEIKHSSSSYLIKVKDKMLLAIDGSKLGFFYGNELDFSEVQEVIKLAKTYKAKRKHNQKFYMISANKHSEYGLELQKFDIKKTKVNVEDNYNDDFIEVDKTISSFLSKKKKNGLILLHGKYGTGKTSYIRHLISSINKRFIFLPLNLMEAISEPGFLPFISEYKESVLILEDAENLLTSRNSLPLRNNALVNLLNIGDGLLSDALSIKIICTFNADLKQIDKAILRKGRLVTRYEFKELQVDKVNKLRSKLSLKEDATEPMTLADIYNKEGINFADMAEKQILGFKK